MISIERKSERYNWMTHKKKVIILGRSMIKNVLLFRMICKGFHQHIMRGVMNLSIPAFQERKQISSEKPNSFVLIKIFP